ncbi:MAG: InlB B-repeat-containing protein, partial [Anaeroplasmataceae bacterium]|nr:InlB B-repeat-containing protein [Anaeroplasmataceae bacterium]
ALDDEPVSQEETPNTEEEISEAEELVSQEETSIIEEAPKVEELASEEPISTQDSEIIEDNRPSDAEEVCQVIRSTLSKKSCTIKNFFKNFLEAIDSHEDLSMTDYKQFLNLICELVKEQEVEEYKKIFAKVLVGRKNRIKAHDQRVALEQTKKETLKQLQEAMDAIEESNYRQKELDSIEHKYETAKASVDALDKEPNFVTSSKKILNNFTTKIKATKTKKQFRKRKRIGIIASISFVVLLAGLFCIGAIPKVTYSAARMNMFTEEVMEYEVSGISGLFMPFHFPMSDVKVEEMHNGRRVTAIADSAFEKEGIRSITLPATVRTIGKEAFKDCKNLKYIYSASDTNEEKVSILLDVTSVKSNAFSGCVSLEELKVSSRIVDIASTAFTNVGPDFKLKYQGTAASWRGKNIWLNGVNVSFEIYTITIKDTIYTIDVRYGDFFILRNIAPKTGYTADGYYFGNVKITSANGTSLSTFKYTYDITVEARYIPNVYTITCDTSGQKVPVRYDADYTLPKLGTSNQGVFIGWYHNGIKLTDEEGKSLSEYTYSGDIIVTAQYKKDFKAYVGNPITVSFDTGAGSQIPDQVLDAANPQLVYPAIPTQTGYIFAGWYENAACTRLYDFNQALDQDKTLYAKWISIYNYEGIALINQTSGQSFTATYTEAYYAFVPLVTQEIAIYSTGDNDLVGYLHDSYGFTLESNDDGGEGGNFRFVYSVTANTLYYIGVRTYGSTNTGVPYRLFVTGEQSVPEVSVSLKEFMQQDVEYGSSYVLSYSTKEGYSFDGYYLDEEFQNQITDNKGVSLSPWTYAKDMQVYPKYTKINYTIAYYLYGGTLSTGETNPTDYNVESSTITLKNPSKPNYIFEGWYKNSNFTGDSITTIPTGSTGSMVLYAKYNGVDCSVKIDGYTGGSAVVTFNSNGGTNVYSQTLTGSNRTLTYPAVPTRSGYIFNGWYTDISCTKKFDFTESINSSMTLYAGWEYISGSGTRVGIVSSNYMNSNYYTLSASGTGTTSSGTKNYAYFYAEADSFTIYLKNSQTSGTSSYRVYYSIYNVTKDSYIRNDFSLDPSSYYTQLSISNVEKGDLLYISVRRYSSYYNPQVQFYFSGISKPTSTSEYDPKFTIEYGSIVTFPIATNSGYTFEGYYLDADLTIKITDETGKLLEGWEYTEEQTLYAKWS